MTPLSHRYFFWWPPAKTTSPLLLIENERSLKVLDEEILTQIDEANNDEEIQQCDICREDLQLALENIEKALSAPSIPDSASASNVTENSSSNTKRVPSQAPTLPQQSNASITSMTLEQNQYSSQPDTSNETPSLGESSMSTPSNPQ